jgi:uncharacterized protein (TIGR03435 family)
MALAAPLLAQSTPQKAFDVASVKANKTPNPRQTTNVPLGPGDAYTPTGGYFSATGVPLLTYIAFAYKIQGNQIPALQSQLPEWAVTDRFDIQARVEGNPGKDQMRLLMQTLLADRFKLAIHRDTSEASVAALVVAKEGKVGRRYSRTQPIHPARWTLRRVGSAKIPDSRCFVADSCKCHRVCPDASTSVGGTSPSISLRTL